MTVDQFVQIMAAISLEFAPVASTLLGISLSVTLILIIGTTLLKAIDWYIHNIIFDERKEKPKRKRKNDELVEHEGDWINAALLEPADDSEVVWMDMPETMEEVYPGGKR